MKRKNSMILSMVAGSAVAAFAGCSGDEDKIPHFQLIPADAPSQGEINASDSTQFSALSSSPPVTGTMGMPTMRVTSKMKPYYRDVVVDPSKLVIMTVNGEKVSRVTPAFVMCLDDRSDMRFLSPEVRAQVEANTQSMDHTDGDLIRWTIVHCRGHGVADDEFRQAQELAERNHPETRYKYQNAPSAGY